VDERDREKTLVSRREGESAEARRVREKAERAIADFPDPDNLTEARVSRAIAVMTDPKPLRAETRRVRMRGWFKHWVRDRLRGTPTWFWEQTVLVALLALTVRYQLPASSTRSYFAVAFSAFGVFVAQKVRSIADRQREANERTGVRDAPVECAVAQEKWGYYSQAFSLISSAVAVTVWPQVLVALYVAAYPLWRHWYRTRRLRALVDVGVAEYAKRLGFDERRPAPPPGADLLHRLADMQSVLVAWVSPNFLCEEELAARIARDVHRDAVPSVLVTHTTVREGEVVQGLAAAKLGVDPERLTVARNHAPLYGSAYDRAYLVVEQADPDPTAWVRVEVLTRLRPDSGRAVVLWTSVIPPPRELQDVGCFVDLRAETSRS
jgi:hypothetical protein